MNKYNLLDKSYNNSNKNILSNGADFPKSNKLFMYNPYEKRDELTNRNKKFLFIDNKK